MSGLPDENLLAQIVLQAVHHADDDDRARSPPTATPPIAIRLMNDSSRDPRGCADSARRSTELEAVSFWAQCGKEDHVADVGVFVRYMNSRSIPMPTPPIGGMPYSIARR